MGPPLTTPTKGKLKRLDFDRNNSDRGSPGKSSSNKKKRSVDVSDAHFLEIEKAKLKLFETSASLKNDSEHQFLISLLPYLKNIPASRQLQVRNKLQQVLIDEQERNSFVAINYKDPLPSTVNQSPEHSSWSNSAYTGYSSDATSESSWDVPPHAIQKEDCFPGKQALFSACVTCASACAVQHASNARKIAQV
ncbi:hypothetical protein J6590_070698 [Homalodisca vitripennis]|nr:hypothetical protein J6590_070698 [Homalodisca vitripennis]